MKTLAKDTRQIFFYNWKYILLFELLYRGITMPVWLRFANRSLRLALRLAGYSYLTAENIGSFLVMPWTVVIGVLAALAGALLLILEAASLIAAFQGAACGEKLNPVKMLWGGLQKGAEQLGRQNWQLGILIICQDLLVNLLFFWRALTHVKPINFVLREVLDEPWAAGFAAVLLLTCFAAVFPLVFMPFECMVSGKSDADSRKQSRSLMKGHRIRVLGSLAGSGMLVAAAVFLVYFLGVLAAALFITEFTEQRLAMAVLSSAADRLEIGLLFLGSILVQTIMYADLSVLYNRYGFRQLHAGQSDCPYPASGTAARKQMTAVLGAAAAVGLLYTFDLVQNGMAIADDFMVEPRITAHRGSSRTAPENTMPAILAAMEEMADIVEIDVQLSKDGVVVLGHDASLKRTAGVNRSIRSMTYEELELLDAGSWFGRDYAGTRIPMLRDVLETCRGEIGLNIELKHAGRDARLPEQVVALIQEYEMTEQCLVTSTSLSSLELVKELEPELKTGYIVSAAYGDFYSSEAVDFISLRSSFVNERLVENIHAQGKGIHAWTVNSKSEMERLVMLGVDGIITDRPILAREIIYREASTETIREYVELMFR